MFWSKAFIPTLREVPQEAECISHQLMLRAGLIKMLMSGVYSYLPLGFKVLGNIEAIIREEMNRAGASELLLPALQPLDLWVRSGRDKDLGEVMIRFADRKGRNLCLGPTHEEVITELAKSYITSYKQLPFTLYQIQTKFRDEMRPRFGVVRACEFIMKDAYSFDRDEEGLNKSYQKMYDAYNRIFKRCGLEFIALEADPGVMGGNLSHEFMVPAESGEDAVFYCSKCGFAISYEEGKEKECPKCQASMYRRNTIEIGHIFKLGTKYSKVLEANFADGSDNNSPVVMGCYGIGVSRLIPTIIEQNYDKDGIIWPDEVTPYQAIILPLDTNEERIMQASLKLYEDLQKAQVETLFDDRNERAGVKFKDADLTGIPIQLILGKDFLKNNIVELKMRRDNSRLSGSVAQIIKKVREVLNG